ncbi:hypothetical protein CMV_011045 [Castanea mollissima]|uniref:Uncharacterized protein n=1 Tax=Castanea mollissima TaxID=60419 RepID=A0A8J4R605_9ROSI|nr:hypothetical protein CMV_011045 [Castanea mollissima]
MQSTSHFLSFNLPFYNSRSFSVTLTATFAFCQYSDHTEPDRQISDLFSGEYYVKILQLALSRVTEKAWRVILKLKVVILIKFRGHYSGH